MIATCRSCHNAFWKYRRDFPPAGYCSLPCHAIGPTAIRSGETPEVPQLALRNIYNHRMTEHETTSILTWFDCEECERLEVRYSNSLEFHYAEITAAIGGATIMPRNQTGLTGDPQTDQKTSRPRAAKRDPGRQKAKNRLQAAC